MIEMQNYIIVYRCQEKRWNAGYPFSRRFAQMNADQDKEMRDARKCGTWVHYDFMNREGSKYAKGYIFFMIR
jgi:hypothetical protein